MLRKGNIRAKWYVRILMVLEHHCFYDRCAKDYKDDDIYNQARNLVIKNHVAPLSSKSEINVTASKKVVFIQNFSGRRILNTEEISAALKYQGFECEV